MSADSVLENNKIYADAKTLVIRKITSLLFVVYCICIQILIIIRLYKILKEVSFHIHKFPVKLKLRNCGVLPRIHESLIVVLLSRNLGIPYVIKCLIYGPQ